MKNDEKEPLEHEQPIKKRRKRKKQFLAEMMQKEQNENVDSTLTTLEIEENSTSMSTKSNMYEESKEQRKPM